MSSAIKVHALSAHHGGGDGKKKAPLAARLLGSGSAGILELILFHPVDTVAKRLMSFEVRQGGGRESPVGLG